MDLKKANDEFRLNQHYTQQLQRIWTFGLMGKWFCIWKYLANPKIGLNLVPNPL
jgi:hypothetical protein